MIAFYCSRCGAALEVDDEHPAGHAVRCASCHSVVRTPDASSDDVPEARLAPPLEEFALSSEAAAVAVPEEQALPFATPFEAEPLDYGIASYPPPGLRDDAALDELAARLERVEHDSPENESGMIECKVCGSTIAPFVRKCPFCRNSLVARV